MGCGIEEHMSGGLILYIEDNFDNRILIKRVLEAEGYTVVEAENGKLGIEKAMSIKPELILMDINLPDIDGYECTARLRKLNGVSRTPIVALTANVMEGDSQKALDAGCDGHIPKPIDVDTLPVQVAAFLKKHAEKMASEAAGSASPAAPTPPAVPTPAASAPPAPAAPSASSPAAPPPATPAPSMPAPAAPAPSVPAASSADKPAAPAPSADKPAVPPVGGPAAPPAQPGTDKPAAEKQDAEKQAG
jgi:CheY-like chemotaxis protein